MPPRKHMRAIVFRLEQRICMNHKCGAVSRHLLLSRSSQEQGGRVPPMADEEPGTSPE